MSYPLFERFPPRVKVNPYPYWVFGIWCEAAGDLICSQDFGLEMTRPDRIWMYLRGRVIHFLFGWWWWK
jgi:hypothetical protein